MERFSGGSLISISLPATDVECLIRNLTFNSLKFKKTAFKRYPPLLAIPMTWWSEVEATFNNLETTRVTRPFLTHGSSVG